MTPKRKKRLLLVLFFIVGTSSLVALVILALNENMNMFFTPSQLIERPKSEELSIKVGGLVVPGSVQRNPDNLEVTFQVSDKQSTVTVHYEGILPDLFAEGQGIIATGHWDGEQVRAHEVLAKHDENYMPPEVKAALEEAGHPVKE